MVKQTLTLKECYHLLKLPQDTGIDDVKQAYRKRAFDLHPDLNPDKIHASIDFQKLNEAYVFLIQYLDTKNNQTATSFFGMKRPSSKEHAKQKYDEAARKQKEKERKDAERQERITLERQAQERRETKERTEREKTNRERLRKEIEKQEVQKIARHDARRKEEAQREEEERAKVYAHMEGLKNQRDASFTDKARAYTNAGKPIIDHNKKYQSTGASGDRFTKSSQKDAAQETTAAHEKLINDLLDDDFARRVYDDIYNEIHAKLKAEFTVKEKKNESFAHKHSFKNIHNINTADTSSNIGEQAPKGISYSASDANKKTLEKSAKIKDQLSPMGQVLHNSGQLVNDVKKGISGWLKNQIDDELELFFPASKLVPGAKMRLQIRVGVSKELHTVEVTLPSDFLPGKPIRLRGMGKRIGKWRGDLYLKLHVK